MDLLDHLHREDVAVGFARELVRAVARPDRDGERVDAGALDDSSAWAGSVRRISPSRPVLDASRCRAALDRHAALVRVVDLLLGHRDVGLEVSAASGVLGQRAVHHDAREAGSIALMQVSGELPWSWCSATGMSGYVSAAASMRWYRKRSPA